MWKNINIEGAFTHLSIAFFGDGKESKEQYDRFMECIKELNNNGIKTEIHYPIAPINQEGYKEIFNEQKGKTEIAEKLANSVLSLPISFGTTEDEVKYVIDVMNKF